MLKSPMPEPGVSGRKTENRRKVTLYPAPVGGASIRSARIAGRLRRFSMLPLSGGRELDDSEPYCQIACF
jgi:hypothetical protein